MKFSILIISMLISGVSLAEVSFDLLYREKNAAHENLKQCSASQESELCQELGRYEGYFGADNFKVIYNCFTRVRTEKTLHLVWGDNTKLCALLRDSVGQ